jgi:hypothetical protein
MGVGVGGILPASRIFEPAATSSPSGLPSSSVSTRKGLLL